MPPGAARRRYGRHPGRPRRFTKGAPVSRAAHDEVTVRVLLAHPSALTHSETFLRLEPLGLERVAGAAREAGHEARAWASPSSTTWPSSGPSTGTPSPRGWSGAASASATTWRSAATSCCATDEHVRALRTARRLGVKVAVNLIVDPSWDEEPSRVVREFAPAAPQIVHFTAMTPCPGTEMVRPGPQPAPAVGRPRPAGAGGRSGRRAALSAKRARPFTWPPEVPLRSSSARPLAPRTQSRHAPNNVER
ncbi:hypothetical protein HDA41_005683 [Streptomyces caelestis]|uniref:Uncharacterized protein n=1 Tax=Streptomyces caelestis TaxID=36816 RepID=A0A7W9H8L0_9ACTN|nr:hypothetical protein [Streptomyces caelestis]